MRYILISIFAATGCTPNSPISTPRDMAAPDLNPMFLSGCMSGAMDGDETDVDCGGSCPGCDTGKGCMGMKDCKSGVCVNRVCAAPACDDKVKNGDESDIDCGGSCPTTCKEGQKCNNGPDCQSLTCVNNVCGPSLCTNGKLDGRETDIDCGGPACGQCGDGKMCSDGTDCSSGMCVNQICKSNCPAGTADCDGNAANGCETNTATDSKNCGQCGRACPAQTPTCTGGQCNRLWAPMGVQENVPVAQLAGWNLCYSDTYNVDLPVAQVLQRCTGKNLMLACRPNNAQTITVLAWAPRADVLFDTGMSTVGHVANNVQWYFSATWSWGFTGVGEAFTRGACDAYDGADRLCWHTSGNIRGYRCGNVRYLNQDATWDRLVYQAN